jgi:hypothetical protein
MTMPLMYRVTASALNVRASPDRTAQRLAAIPTGAIVARMDDPALASDWLKISWSGHIGYSASAYLQAVEGAPVLPGAAHSDMELPRAPGVEERDRDMAKLHPRVREGVTATLAALTAKGIPFRVFEGFRSPERQTWLYRQGRTRPGGKVTRAQAWQSMHQYGLATDLVLFTDAGWSWDSSGSNRPLWQEMQAQARKHGLAPLSFELPHVELTGSQWQLLQQGHLPDGGDESWYDGVALAAERWRRAGRAPYAPPVRIGERPELPADA